MTQTTDGVRYIISAQDDTGAAWKTALENARKAASGISGAAQQSANSLRMVGPQITDIFTSLGSGQSPFTVLLQQGGQLKDMFGGIGPAARAVGGYVAGLVNPFTVAAGAAAGFAYVLNKGAQEAENMARAVIMTGGAVGKTSDQLLEMSRRVSDSAGVTTSTANEATQAMIKTGEVGGGALDVVTEAALNLEKIGGVSVAESAKSFAQLGKEPVQASIELNKQYHYLTAATFQQIKALEDEGRHLEAGALAQKAYAEAMNRRMGEVRESLSMVSKAWLAVEETAAKAWKAMLGGGEKRTAYDEIRAQEALIGRIRSGEEVGNIDVAQKHLAFLKEAARLNEESAKSSAKKKESEAASTAWLQEGEKYLSRQAIRDREIRNAKRLGEEAGIDPEEIKKRIAAINEKYKDPAGPKGPKGPKPDYNLGQDLDAARAYADAIKTLSGLQQAAKEKADELTGAEAALARIMASPEWERMPQAWRDVIRAQAEAASAAEQQVRAQQILREAYDRTIQPLRDRVAELERENDLYGLTEAQLNTVIAARLDEAVAIARANGANEDQIAILERERDLRFEIAKQAGDKDLKDMDRKRIQDEADLWKRATDDIAQAFTDAIFRGGQSGWKLFMNVVKASVIRATILPQMQQEIGGAINAGKGLFGEAAGALKGLLGGGNSTAAAAKSAEDYIDAGGMAGGGGGFGDMFSKLMAGLPSFDVGTNYVPADMVAKIHRGERIVRAADNRPGFGGFTQHLTIQVSGAVDQRTAGQIGAQVGAQTRRAMRRNGVR